MLSRYERDAMSYAMHPELEARPSVLIRYALAILAVIALGAAAPLARLSSAGEPAGIASPYVLERLLGLCN